jgi:hypothetical protein
MNWFAGWQPVVVDQRYKTTPKKKARKTQYTRGLRMSTNGMFRPISARIEAVLTQKGVRRWLIGKNRLLVGISWQFVDCSRWFWFLCRMIVNQLTPLSRPVPEMSFRRMIST